MVENCRTDTSTSYRKALVKEVTTLTEKNSPKKLCEKTQTQMFSCEFCEKFKTTCFTEQLQITASVSNSYLLYLSLFKNLFTFFSLLYIKVRLRHVFLETMQSHWGVVISKILFLSSKKCSDLAYPILPNKCHLNIHVVRIAGCAQSLVQST